jgi:hypothetical protein
MDREHQRTYAMYAFARVAFCLYNAAKTRGWWRIGGVDFDNLGGYGDSLLFILSSGQIMYGYVMRPESLQPSYYRFIVKTGPIEPYVLNQFSANCSGAAIDHEGLNKFCSDRGYPGNVVDGPFPAGLSAYALHPQHRTSMRAVWQTFSDGFTRSFPMYFGVYFGMSNMFRFGRFLQDPLAVSTRLMQNTLRSTLFLSCFVSWYMAAICGYKHAISNHTTGILDSKYIYYAGGLVSGCAIFVENTWKRHEFALYVLPRAADSLMLVLKNRGMVRTMERGEVLLFSLSWGALLYFFKNERETLSPWVATVMVRR